MSAEDKSTARLTPVDSRTRIRRPCVAVSATRLFSARLIPAAESSLVPFGSSFFFSASRYGMNFQSEVRRVKSASDRTHTSEGLSSCSRSTDVGTSRPKWRNMTARSKDMARRCPVWPFRRSHGPLKTYFESSPTHTIGCHKTNKTTPRWDKSCRRACCSCGGNGGGAAAHLPARAAALRHDAGLAQTGDVIQRHDASHLGQPPLRSSRLWHNVVK